MHHTDLSPRGQYLMLRKLPLPIQLLLYTQLMFNIGFYIVVPFLAVFMSESLAATGAMIGLVLGVRTFSQQGMFFVGGALTDRFGVKRILLIGIALRVLGFLVAGFSTGITQLMLGVILIGFAAALFSPAAEAALAASAAHGKLPISRAQLFALDGLMSRMGALIGPVLGAVLIPFGFNVVSVIGAIIFAALFIAHFWFVPAVEVPRSKSLLEGIGEVFRNGRFMIFALGYSSMLVAYNQQYLSLPMELERALGNTDALGWMFVYASIFNIVLQMSITHVTKHWSQRRALGVGFGTMAIGFGVLAIVAPLSPLPGYAALIPVLLMLSGLHLGQMVAVPRARDMVGVLAKERNLGTYFGVLNSFGGAAVLVSSFALGFLLDDATTPQPTAALPWAVLVGLMLLSGAILLVMLRSLEPKGNAPTTSMDDAPNAAEAVRANTQAAMQGECTRKKR